MTPSEDKEQESFKPQATSVILGFGFVEEDGTRMGRMIMIDCASKGGGVRSER